MILYTNGCSHTQGYGMPDIGVDGVKGKPGSKYAWPAVLANKLGCELINEGMDASSMDRITRTTLIALPKLLEEYEPQDILVGIMPTHYSRYEVYREDEKKFHTLAPWLIQNRLEQWPGSVKVGEHFFYHVYTDVDAVINFYKNILLIQQFCAQKGIKLFMPVFDNEWTAFWLNHPSVDALRSMLDCNFFYATEGNRRLGINEFHKKHNYPMYHGHPSENGTEHYVEEHLLPWVKENILK